VGGIVEPSSESEEEDVDPWIAFINETAGETESSAESVIEKFAVTGVCVGNETLKTGYDFN
jgi:hypothetical protein